jgi:outer membrane lipoprotein-sorting protein
VKRRDVVLSLFAAPIILAVRPARAEGPTARELVDRLLAQEIVGWEGARARVRMVLSAPNATDRVRAMDVVSRRVQKRLKMLIRFRAPADIAGTAFLLLEGEGGATEQYMYLPSLAQTRRIVGAARRGAFLGSDLTYGDLEQSHLRSASHALLPEEAVGDTPCYLVESTLAADAPYAKIRTWVRKDNRLPQRARFFDARGAVVKTVYTRRIKTVDDVPAIVEARIEAASGRATTIVVEEVTRTASLPDSAFTPTALEHE